jgi:hypothetical protein
MEQRRMTLSKGGPVPTSIAHGGTAYANHHLMTVMVLLSARGVPLN